MTPYRKVMHIFFIFFIFFVVFSVKGIAITLETGITIDDGTGTAYETIQAAVNAAGDGDTVLVEDGIYMGEGNRDIDFNGKAITVRSVTGNPENCIIDCERAGRGFHFHTEEGPASVVSGFSIINGVHEEYGGGIYCDGSSPTIENCIISGNSADIGGGIFCYLLSSPTIRNCTISGNSASEGGGVYCDFSSPTFEECIIDGNEADNGGGGIYCSFVSSPTLKSCTISGNSANEGGGIYCDFSSPVLENCIVSGNSTGLNGGGIYCSFVSSPALKNCTISGNSAILGGGVFCQNSSPAITNTILENNDPDAIYEFDLSSDPLVTYCLFFNNLDGDYYDLDTNQYYTGESSPGSGLSNTNTIPDGKCRFNLYGDPGFTEGDYYPESCSSPAVDTGTSVDSPLLDIEGTSRPQGLGYDMGAFESVFPDIDEDLVFDECDNCPLNPNTDQADADNDGIGDICEGDFNIDGVIDTKDLDILLANLNKPASSFPACDLNSDGVITVLDVLVLIKINPLLARDRRVRTLFISPSARSRR